MKKATTPSIEHTNKWCVTVLELPDKKIIAQDFFPERWKALACAQDCSIPQHEARTKSGAAATDDDD